MTAGEQLCARCARPGDLHLDPVREWRYCVPCSARNHTDDGTRIVELVIPRVVAHRFADVAAGAIETAAEQLIDGRGDSPQWRELNIIRINAFHALAKHAALRAREGSDIDVRAGWWVLARVLRDARDHERDLANSIDATRFDRLLRTVHHLGARIDRERETI